jgi:hypothetical protein
MSAWTSNKIAGLAFKHAHAGYVPDPDKPGWLKYDEEKYIKILKQEAQKRQQVMQQIIETRHLGSSVKD